MAIEKTSWPSANVCRLIIFACVLVMYAGYAKAACPPCDEQFSYSESDFSMIDDWDAVDWSKIPPSRISEVPAESLRYDRLSPGQRLVMSPGQIAQNLDLIDDLAKDVDKAGAEQAAMLRYGVRIDIGSGARIKGGMLEASYGARGRIHMSDISSGALARIDEEGNILLIGQEDQLPSQGEYVACFDDATEIRLPGAGSITVEGELSCLDGRCSVRKGDRSSISDVEIFSAYNDVDIFLDGKPHQGNYISFGDRNAIIQGEDFEARFLEGNRYLDVKSSEYDLFVVSPKNNGRITITQNTGDSAPEVVVTGPSKQAEWARIVNGKFDSILGNEGIMSLDASKALQSSYGSVPMQIRVVDEKGDNLIKGADGQDAKIVIDNDNNLGYISIDTHIQLDGTMSCDGSKGSGGVISGAITANGIFDSKGGLWQLACRVGGIANYRNSQKHVIIQSIHASYGKGTESDIEFVRLYILSAEELARLEQSLSEIKSFNPELLRSVNTIEFFDSKIMTEGGCDTLGRITIGSGSLSVQTLVHEAAHAHQFKLKREGKSEEFEDEWYKAQGDGDAQKGRAEYGTLAEFIPDDTDDEDDMDNQAGRFVYRQEYVSSLIDIDADVIKDMVDDGKAVVDAIAGAVYPFDTYVLETGYVRAYGNKNIWEDGATIIDYAKLHDNIPHLDNPKYRRKAELLCEYGYLSRTHNICQEVMSP